MMAKSSYDLYIDTTAEEGSSLALVRFPAMKSQFENPADLIQLSVRPKSMKVKLDVSLDCNSPSFCHERAQQLGGKSAPKTFATGLVDKNFFTSTRTTVEDGQLFVCKTIDDRIVCRPVSNLFTMRSDFGHFDLKEEVDPMEEVRPVSVKFAATDRQSGSGAQVKSRGGLPDDDDPLDEYRRLSYKTVNSREANTQRVALFGEPLPKVKPDPDAEPVDKKPAVIFHPDIKPKIEKMDVDDIYSSEASITSVPNTSRTAQIKQKVKECLVKAKIVSFEEIYHYIRESYDSTSSKNQRIPINNKDILDALNDIALLVQGNWAIKSEVLYGDSSERSCTDVTGISINLFVAARDYLLWLFTQDTLVGRLEYSRRVKMPDHDILDLFNQLATYRADIKKWELKLPTDTRFLERFPDIVQRQATFWKVRRANKLGVFTS